MSRIWITTHFTADELGCRHCGRYQFHTGFTDHLERLREAFGRRMTPTSACRCARHNKTVGGHPKSLHVMDEPSHPGQTGTMAIDIATADGEYRGHLFATAWRLGWSIGWNAKRNFLHLDRRTDLHLPQTTFDY